MSKLRIAVLGFIVVLTAVYFTVIHLVAPGLLVRAIPAIEDGASAYLNGQLKIEQINISGTLELTAHQVAVYDQAGEPVLKAPSVVITLSPLQGLFHADPLRAIERIIVDKPVLRLSVDAEEHWNVATLLKPTETTSTAVQTLVQLKEGTVEVTTPYGQWQLGVAGTIATHANPVFAVDLAVTLQGEQLTLVGKIDTATKGALTLKTTNLNLANLAAVAQHYGGVEALTGTVQELNLRWENTGNQVALTGAGYLRQVAGQVTYEDYSWPLVLEGKVNFHDLVVNAEELDVTLAGQRVVVNGGLNLATAATPRFEALKITLHNFDPAQVMPQIPVAGALNGEVVFTGTPEALGVGGVLRAGELVVAGQTWRQVQVPVNYQDGKLSLPGVQALYGEGKLTLWGEYTTASGQVAASLNLDNFNVAALAGLTEETILTSGEIVLAGQVADEQLQLNTVSDLTTTSWRGAVFNKLAFDVTLAPKGATINNFSCYINDNGVVTAHGKIHKNLLELQVDAINLPLAPCLALVGEEGTGLLSTTLQLGGTPEAYTARGSVSVTAAEVYGQKVNEAHSDFTLVQTRLTLQEGVATLPAGEHRFHGWIDLSELANPTLGLSITTTGVRVEPLAAYVHPGLKVTGNLDNEVTLNGTLRNPQIQGKLNFYDGSFEGYLLSDVTGEYTYDQQALELRQVLVHTLGTTIKLNGQMAADGQLDFTIDAQAIKLNRFPALLAYAKVGGAADFIGTIKGHLGEPLFDGRLTAAAITINGEEVNDINWQVTSRGGFVNKFEGDFTQRAGGKYKVDLLLDLNQALLQGDIAVQGGSVHSLFKMGKMEYDLAGKLDGLIKINEFGKGTGISVNGKVREGSIRGVKFQTVDFALNFHLGVWHINKLKAVEEDLGFMLAQGTVDVKKGNISLEVGGTNTSAELLTAFMLEPVSFDGNMDFTAQISGTLDNPVANGSVQITQGQVSGVTFDNFYGMFTLKDDVYRLDQLFLEKDIYRISAYGTLPQDLFRAEENRHNPQASMDIEVKLDNANLSILPSLTPWVAMAQGEIKGGLKVAGTLEEPSLYGKVLLHDGLVQVKTVKTLLENITLEVDFQGKQIVLKELSSTLGKKGKILAQGNFSFTEAETAPYLLEAQLEQVEIDSTIFKGQLNGQAKLTQKRGRPHVAGTVRFDDVLLNLPTLPEFAKSQTNIGLDLNVEFGPKIHLFNKYLYDLWLSGGLHIGGSTRYTIVNGTLNAPRGTISYLRTPFKLTKATAAFPEPGNPLPSVMLEAQTRFGRYDIFMKVQGPVEQMELALTSEPPLGQQELFRMLTLKSYAAGGQTGNNSDGFGQEDVQGLLSAGLQMTFLGDVEYLMKDFLQLDEFRVYNGTVRSSLGFDIASLNNREATKEEREQYNILVSKYLTKNILLGYTSSFDGKDSSVFAQLSLSNKLNLSCSVDEKKQKWYGLEYKISF
ncbi:MAG: translocation/assembly module TamB domain-containing protein [Acidaminococcaceae bacterium]